MLPKGFYCSTTRKAAGRNHPPGQTPKDAGQRYHNDARPPSQNRHSRQACVLRCIRYNATHNAIQYNTDVRVKRRKMTPEVRFYVLT